MPSGRLSTWAYARALTLFRHLPRPVRLRVVRLVTPGYTSGALCLLDCDGRLLLLRQRHRNGWSLPGGLMHRGETAEVAVVRDVEEETGLRVEVGLPLTVIVEPSSRRIDILFHVPVPQEPAVTPGSEATGAAWLRPEECGPVDEPTRKAFAAFADALAHPSRTGRVLSPGSPER